MASSDPQHCLRLWDDYLSRYAALYETTASADPKYCLRLWHLQIRNTVWDYDLIRSATRSETSAKIRNNTAWNNGLSRSATPPETTASAYPPQCMRLRYYGISRASSLTETTASADPQHCLRLQPQQIRNTYCLRLQSQQIRNIVWDHILSYGFNRSAALSETSSSANLQLEQTIPETTASENLKY